MSLTVDISIGNHTINIPDDMDELILNMLREVGIHSGKFKVSLGERIRGSAACSGLKGIKICGFNETTKSFVIKAQPDANDTRHRCTVYFPKMHVQHAPELYEKLVNRFGNEFSTKAEVPKIETVAEVIVDEAPAPEIAAEPALEVVETTTDNDSSAPTMSVSKYMDNDMTFLIIEEIAKRYSFDKWIKKPVLLKLLSSLDLEMPANKIAGYLLGREYLEKNPTNPEDQCKLNYLAFKKLTELKKPEPLSLESLQSLSDERRLIMESIKPHEDEITNLENEIAKIEELIIKKRNKQAALQAKIDERLSKVTEAHHEAHRRIKQINELINTPLPN